MKIQMSKNEPLSPESRKYLKVKVVRSRRFISRLLTSLRSGRHCEAIQRISAWACCEGRISRVFSASNKNLGFEIKNLTFGQNLSLHFVSSKNLPFGQNLVSRRARNWKLCLRSTLASLGREIGNFPQRGFTLVELLIGISVFLFVLFILESVIGGLLNSSFRALAMKRLADNTRTSLEIMGREMRLAQSKVSSCSGMGSEVFQVAPGGGRVKFKDFQGRCVLYEYDAPNKVIWKNVNDLSAGCTISNCEKFLGGSQVFVDAANFTMIKTPTKPRLTITMLVSTFDPSTPGRNLSVSLQTTISQREP